MYFAQINEQIAAPDDAARAQAHERWNRVAKPIGGLGVLESMVEQIAALTGSPDVDVRKRCAVVMCADNGVVAQGVTQTGSDVTRAVAESIASGTSSICSMARVANVDTFAVDVGMAHAAEDPRVVDLHVARGTADISRGPAMAASEAEQALRAGMRCAREAARRGYRLIAVGEMGIGNTTTTSALACTLLELSPEAAVGRGAGLSDAGLARKVAVVRRALAVNAPDGRRAGASADPGGAATDCSSAAHNATTCMRSKADSANPTDTSGAAGADRSCTPRADGAHDAARNDDFNGCAPWDAFYALRTLGGFDIAAMTGLYLGCALERVPAIIDGAVSAMAALIAVKLCPACRCALLPSHLPSEPSARAVFDALGLSPILHADMHLGEATGAVCLVPLLDMALSLYNGTTFAQTGIASYKADLR